MSTLATGSEVTERLPSVLERRGDELRVGGAGEEGREEREIRGVSIEIARSNGPRLPSLSFSVNGVGEELGSDVEGSGGFADAVGELVADEAIDAMDASFEDGGEVAV